MKERLEKSLDHAIVDLLNYDGSDPMEQMRLESIVYILDKLLVEEYGMESVLEDE